jgi:MinD-like ATPase involved in chromosome partitioning or flagellar assembly
MSKIISVHSFRGGTGKSNTTANLTALLANQGQRVGVVDTDIQSPGIHALFGLDEENMTYSLNDYLNGKCDIQQAAHDVTNTLGSPIKGKIYLVPSSIKTGEIMRVLKDGVDPGLLNDGFHSLLEELRLDTLMIDTHPGLNEETMLSIAISDALAILLRPDRQDFQGTAVTVEVARQLGIPRMVLVVNRAPTIWDPVALKAQVERTYNAEVAAVLPNTDEMMTLASEGIFALRYPNHPLTALLKRLADRLVS